MGAAYYRYTPRLSNEDAQALLRKLLASEIDTAKMLAKTTVVMVTPPEWMRAGEAQAYFGVTRAALVAAASQGLVRCAKLDKTNNNSPKIFKVADIRRWLDDLAEQQTGEQPENNNNENNNTKENEKR